MSQGMSQSPIRRINIFGAAGTGKSNTRQVHTGLINRAGLKLHIEDVHEYVKRFIIAGNIPQMKDQENVFVSQKDLELSFLFHKVDAIITDSPTLIGLMHLANYYGDEGSKLAETLWPAQRAYDAQFQPFNIFLTKGRFAYQQQGRFQTEEQAATFHDFQLDYLRQFYGEDPVFVKSGDDQAMFKTLYTALAGTPPTQAVIDKITAPFQNWTA